MEENSSVNEGSEVEEEVGNDIEEGQVVKSPEELMADIRVVFSQNPLYFGWYYFKDHFRYASPYFHEKIIVEALKNLFFAIQCPRGSAKSTLLCFLYIIWSIVFKKRRHIVIVQNTFLKACGSLESIKNEFKTNQMLIEHFRIEVVKDSSGDSIFKHPDGFRTRVLCKGSEQIGSVRGEKFGAYRPDLILVDDLEDDTMVKSAERRNDIQRLFDDALVPAGEQGITQVIVVGTILHDDCLMAKLVSKDHYKEYRKLFYKALYRNKKTGDFLSLWNEKWTVEELLHLRKTKPEVFAKEYQGNPVSGSLAKFHKEDFRRWNIVDGHYVLYNADSSVQSKGLLSDCKGAIGCDMAWEESKQSDDTAIMPIFITPNSEILVYKYFNKKGVRPDEFENYLFQLEDWMKKLTKKIVFIAFEKGKIEKINKWFLAQAMRRRNRFLSLKDVAWVSDKIARIVTPLQPRYAMNTIFHMEGMGDLEYQLMRIPSGTHDDLPDALQLAVRVLEYAPSLKKESFGVEDEGFEYLMGTIKKKKNEGKNPFVFGKSKSLTQIPAKKTWR